MTVRAKFHLNAIEATMYRRYKPGQENVNVVDRQLETVEMRTLKFSPVGSDSEENKLFWEASPSGKLELGTVNEAAWSLFELGKTYYLDFTPAD